MFNPFRILSVFMALGLICGHAAEKEVIDLSKPVIESVPIITGIYWNFDEMAGPQELFLDGSGEENNGIPMAGNGEAPSVVDGVNRPGTSGFGKAVRLSTKEPVPGTEGNPRVLVNMKVTNSLTLADTSFTGGLWVRFSSIRPEENQTVILIDKGGYNTRSGGNGGHFCMFLVKDREGVWQVGFQAGDGMENQTALSGPLLMEDFQEGQWHHIGFNFDYNPDGGSTVSFWFDGAMVGSQAITLNLAGGSADTRTRRLSVGERTTTLYVSTFDGELDDLFVTEGHFDFKPLVEP